MEYLEKELSQFIVKDDKVFLLNGKWGVGKTYAVTNFLKTNFYDNYSIINLSLFGVSSTSELLNQLLNETNTYKQFFKSVSKLLPTVGFNIGVFNASLDLSNISGLVHDSVFKDQKPYLFVIDDIERKDNKLSIEDVFGFVESLKLNKSKIILICNSEHLDKDREFFNFKEKVVDREFNISRPTITSIKEILSNTELFNLISNIENYTNLRTIIKFNKFIRAQSIDITDINKGLLNALLLCIDSKDRGIDLNRELQKKNIIEINRNNSLFNIKNVSSEIHDFSEIDSKPYTYPNSQAFSLFYYDNEAFVGADSDIVKSNLSKIYTAYFEHNYDVFQSIRFNDQSNPLFNLPDTDRIIFYSDNITSEINNQLTSLMASNNQPNFEVFKILQFITSKYDGIILSNKDLESRFLSLREDYLDRFSEYIVKNSSEIISTIDNMKFSTSSLANQTVDLLRDIVTSKIYDNYSEKFDNNDFDFEGLRNLISSVERILGFKVLRTKPDNFKNMYLLAYEKLVEFSKSNFNEERYNQLHLLSRAVFDFNLIYSDNKIILQSGESLTETQKFRLKYFNLLNTDNE